MSRDDELMGGMEYLLPQWSNIFVVSLFLDVFFQLKMTLKPQSLEFFFLRVF